MGQNGEGYSDPVWLSLRSSEQEEKERQKLVRMKQQIKLAAVILMSSFIDVKPAQLPTVRSHIINDVIQVDQPTSQKTGNCCATRAVTRVSGQTDTGRSDDVMYRTHKS